MKKTIYFLVSCSLLFTVTNSSAQNSIGVHSTQQHFRPSADFNRGTFKTDKPAAGPTVYVLDYDSADATVFGKMYYHYQGELMNTHYAWPKDTTGGQNPDCINYFSVAFDSLIDPYQKVSTTTSSVSSLKLDTIYIPLVQINHSGANDTLEVQINNVTASGYPGAMVKDTFFISKNIGANSNSAIAFKKWGLNYTLTVAPLNKFAVTVKYSGSKKDSCWFIYGFGYFNGPCPTGTNVLASYTHFSKIGSGASAYYSNSFALWNQNKTAGTLPTSTGGNIYYNCYTPPKGVSKDTAGDGQNYLQNINIYSMVTLNTLTGMNELTEKGFTVGQNFPNPFDKNTVITYNLDKTSDIAFSVFDITGRTLISNTLNGISEGGHTISLNANQFTPGIYFYSFVVNGVSVTKKMVITE